MKRKQLGKRVISIVTAATMLLSQGTVMASDLSVDSNGIENQEVAVYENEEEQDLTEEISDAEEDTDIIIINNKIFFIILKSFLMKE